MRRIAVLYNPFSESSIGHSQKLAEWLEERQIEVWRGISQECRNRPQVLQDTDLMMAMGGDGTILRAARLVFSTNIPVLPVALGRLSFMAEIGPNEVYDSLESLMSGGGWYDKRTLLSGEIWRKGELIRAFTALNEVVISRSDMSRIINAEVTINDSRLTNYHADGVIVATATGSTAYALAAGGPIVDPRSHSLLLVPIAAHLTNIPSMVLDADTTVTIVLRSRHDASISVDGRDNVVLCEGDQVIVKRSTQSCTFVRLHPRNEFYTNLVAKLRRG